MKAIHLLYSLKQGGGENVALNYSKVFKCLGIDSIIVGEPADKTFENVLSQYAEIRYSFDLKLLKDADIIIIHCNQWLIRLLKYLPIIKARKIRVIYIQHLNYSHAKFIGVASLVNIICTDFIRITPNTEKLVNKYIFISKHFIVNFYLQHYERSEWEGIRRQLRDELGISQSDTVVCFSAILKPGKRVEDFLKFAGKCYDNNKIRFLLVGDGPERTFVEEYPYNNIVWVGRVNDVEKYLIASDIYFFSSKWEMMPMALIEAVNTDKRVIAYSTKVNNFMLDGKTFVDITDPIVLQADLPCGENLRHYDFNYGIEQLSDLISK